MKGKVVLITGGTSGIGKWAAHSLAGMGARVVVVGRNAEKGASAVAWIRQTTGSEDVTYLQADLSSQVDVRRLAAEFSMRFDRLDVLMNNAGSVFSGTQMSADGIEMTWALNHFHYFLLTCLLLNRLKESTPSRIINTSSIAHRWGWINFKALERRKLHGGFITHFQTKLANVCFSYELARRLQGSGVTANAFHPGYVASRFGLNPFTIYTPIFKLLSLFEITPQEGAETAVYLASAPGVEGVSGRYFVKKKKVQSSRASYNRKASERLWDISLRMTGLKREHNEKGVEGIYVYN